MSKSKKLPADPAARLRLLTRILERIIHEEPEGEEDDRLRLIAQATLLILPDTEEFRLNREFALEIEKVYALEEFRRTETGQWIVENMEVPHQDIRYYSRLLL